MFIFTLKIKIFTKHMKNTCKSLIFQDFMLILVFLFTNSLIFQGLFKESDIFLMNVIFTLLFLLEMFIKLTGLGFQGFYLIIYSSIKQNLKKKI